jgi:hypothetical protein
MYDPRIGRLYYEYKIPESEIQGLFKSGSLASRLIRSEEFNSLKTEEGVCFGEIVLKCFKYSYVTVIDPKNNEKLKQVWDRYQLLPYEKTVIGNTIDKIYDLLGDSYLIMEHSNATEIASIKLEDSPNTPVGFLHTHIYGDYSNVQTGQNRLKPPLKLEDEIEKQAIKKYGRFAYLIE